MVAVVPLRDGRSGKSRLSRSLAPDERAELVTVLARHVVGTLVGSGEVERVLVVTADVAFASSGVCGLGPRVAVVGQPPARLGLNSAIELGREIACAAIATSVLLVVHADLPALSPADVAALLVPSAAVVLAPDRFGAGTNALVLRPAASPFTFRFGRGSLAAHVAEAVGRGIEPALVARPGTAIDLDTPADWAELPRDVRERVLGAVPAMSSLAVRH